MFSGPEFQNFRSFGGRGLGPTLISVSIFENCQTIIIFRQTHFGHNAANIRATFVARPLFGLLVDGDGQSVGPKSAQNPCGFGQIAGEQFADVWPNS